ncbi:MAG: Crp/Fnr family transcriptional regulator [Bacteroidia bacterium]|jgi:CRP-like cAMP-binding protein|nr:Crp/Fnr family transcriptional regulator [Bacteroidia bacterium]
MQKTLADYVALHTPLSDEDRQILLREIEVRHFPKGTVLLSEGEIARECYFVLSGCIRQYQLIDGEEKTTAFYTQGEAAVSLISFSQQVPANHFFVCEEDTTATAGGTGSEEQFLARHPKFAEVIRIMLEQSFGKTKDEFARFITSTPEQRYLQLLEQRPDLLQRVPQHQLASYIGVTPESLSRIRKRIIQRH